MPNQPSQRTFLPNYLNACNSTTPTGAANPVTGAAIPTGSVGFRVISLSFAEAQQLQAPSPSIEQLYEGDYQFVQVDSGATQANVGTGLAAYYKINPANNSVSVISTVTDEANATSTSLFAGVFLNPITVNNYGYIFCGQGRVNVTYKSSLTNGTPAIGDEISCGGGSGTFDDIGAGSTSETAKVVGIATVKPVAGGTSPIFIKDPIFRI